MHISLSHSITLAIYVPLTRNIILTELPTVDSVVLSDSIAYKRFSISVVPSSYSRPIRLYRSSIESI